MTTYYTTDAHRFGTCFATQDALTAPTPVPTPPTPSTDTGGSGGGTANPFDYLKWYDGELRPNWYHYPEERKALKDAITKVAKQKKSIESKLATSRIGDGIDFNREIALLENLKKQLEGLIASYTQMISMLHAKKLEDDEEEEILMMILSEM